VPASMRQRGLLKIERKGNNMKIRDLFFATTAIALAAAPIAAQAQPSDRASEPMIEEAELGGGKIGPALIIGAIAAVGIIALIVSDNDDDEDPVSV
jgi:hypothetical protein